MEDTKALNSKDYLDMLRDSAKMIVVARSSKEHIPDKQMAELYSIYYNVFAGALRAKVMFEKQMDTDGYPKYLIAAANEKYYCKDAPLRDILRDDYERITKFPYVDSSESYVNAYGLIKSYATLEYASLDQGMTLAGSDSMSEEAKAKLKKKVLQAEKRKQEALLKEKNRQLLKDARGFDYDPNYDHYYSDRLPEILRELDSSAMDTAARIIGIVVSSFGIVCALAFL